MPRHQPCANPAQRHPISDNPRYVKTVEHFGYLAQQATVFGQHVHVGCQSGDDAIYLLHGLSRFVPHFIALNAASPWFDSTDSRFACSRLNRFSSYPDNGPMPWVADWQGFRRLFRQLSYTSMIDSMKDLHWDIRPSPQFGTVEVRARSTQSRVKYKGEKFPPFNTPDIKRGDIIVESDLYTRYAGELQVALKDMKNSGKSNVVARIVEEELFLLDYIEPWTKFSFKLKK